MVLVVRPGYRIGSRTIKRGSRESNLIVSDKGIATKAHYLSTPGGRSGNCIIRVRPKYRHSQNTS
jgi:hypothetical protein